MIVAMRQFKPIFIVQSFTTINKLSQSNSLRSHDCPTFHKFDCRVLSQNHQVTIIVQLQSHDCSTTRQISEAAAMCQSFFIKNVKTFNNLFY